MKTDSSSETCDIHFCWNNSFYPVLCVSLTRLWGSKSVPAVLWMNRNLCSQRDDLKMGKEYVYNNTDKEFVSFFIYKLSVLLDINIFQFASINTAVLMCDSNNISVKNNKLLKPHPVLLFRVFANTLNQTIKTTHWLLCFCPDAKHDPEKKRKSKAKTY